MAPFGVFLRHLPVKGANLIARQEAQSKLLDYPTSEQVIDLAATWLTNPTHSCLADHYVGEGEALGRLQAALGDCEMCADRS